jgi:predicted tellurium resistance membrane protein TerC
VELLELMRDPQAWVGLLTLTALELVLGVDNIIFIAILAGKLPAGDQKRARNVGLTLALGTRILLLLSIAWIARLTTPLFGLLGHEVSGRDLVLLIGGLFLIGKATTELHGKLEGATTHESGSKVATFGAVLVQIMLLDIVFSIDSVITAVGMVQHVPVMIAANVLALFVMLWASGTIAGFVERHPTIKVLALSFLVMIGFNLFTEGLGYHIPKGYTYFAMAFALAVEVFNLRLRARAAAVHLHRTVE